MAGILSENFRVALTLRGALLACALLACGGVVEQTSGDPSGGYAGAAHAAGGSGGQPVTTVGSGNANGVAATGNVGIGGTFNAGGGFNTGGAVSVAGAFNDPKCTPQPLDCARLDDCPGKLADLAYLCASATSNSTEPNSCGGITWSTSGAFSGTDYYFDAAGRLVGIQGYSDEISNCPDGASSTSILYGQRCPAIGDSLDPCRGVIGTGGAGGAPDDSEAGRAGVAGAE